MKKISKLIIASLTLFSICSASATTVTIQNNSKNDFLYYVSPTQDVNAAKYIYPTGNGSYSTATVDTKTNEVIKILAYPKGSGNEVPCTPNPNDEKATCTIDGASSNFTVTYTAPSASTPAVDFSFTNTNSANTAYRIYPDQKPLAAGSTVTINKTVTVNQPVSFTINDWNNVSQVMATCTATIASGTKTVAFDVVTSGGVVTCTTGGTPPAVDQGNLDVTFARPSGDVGTALPSYTIQGPQYTDGQTITGQWHDQNPPSPSLPNIEVGSYKVTINPVVVGSTTYLPTPAEQTVAVTKGQTSTLNVTYTQEPTVVGTINVSFPTAPSGAQSQTPTITVKGPSYTSGKTFDGTWGQTLPIASLTIGTYSLTADSITAGSTTYKSTVTPSSVTLDKNKLEVPVSVTYSPINVTQCVKGQLSTPPANNWYVQSTLTITNTCGETQDLTNATLSFESSNTNSINYWGDTGQGSFTLSPNPDTSKTAPIASLKLSGTQEQMNLATNASITMALGFNLNGQMVDIANANNTLTVKLPEYGKIKVTFPTQPDSSITSPPSATLVGTGYPAPGKTITGTWGASTDVDKIELGSYTMTGAVARTSDGKTAYGATMNPSSFTLGEENISQPLPVTASYKKLASGTLTVTVGSSPASGLDKPYLQVKDTTTGDIIALFQADWGKTAPTINNLIETDSYEITGSSVTDSSQGLYVANIQPATFTLSADKLAVASAASYSKSSGSVTFGSLQLQVNMVGNTSKLDVTFVNQADNSIIVKEVPAGASTVSLPVGSYLISTSTVEYNGETYYARPVPLTTVGSTPASATISFAIKPAFKRIYAPYIDVSGLGNSTYAFMTLSDIYQKGQVKNLTLAFVLADIQKNTCTAAFAGVDPNTTNMKSEIDNYRALGGDVLISFGGANGPYVEDNCTSANDLAKAYTSIVNTYNVHYLDFDVEGGYISNASKNQMRAGALVQMQAADPTLQISFTLPVLPTGLTADGVNFLKTNINAGVDINRVNIMAMDYGNSVADPNQMGQNAINAALALIEQLRTLYPNKSTSQLEEMVGITPMIGVNDVPPELFTLDNADEVVEFALTRRIPLLANWSVNRDQACEGGASYLSPTCSGVQQQPYDFAKRFGVFAP